MGSGFRLSRRRQLIGGATGALHHLTILDSIHSSGNLKSSVTVAGEFNGEAISNHPSNACFDPAEDVDTGDDLMAFACSAYSFEQNAIFRYVAGLRLAFVTIRQQKTRLEMHI
jgi:hypothetical protein